MNTPGTGRRSLRNLSKPGVSVVLLMLLLAAAATVIILSGCGSSEDASERAASGQTTEAQTPDTPSTEKEPPAPKADFTGSGFPGVDRANTRELDGPIERKTVAQLEQVWSHPIDGASKYGSYTASPVISKGVIYSQDLASNVETIDLKTGELLWRKDYDAPSEGPNGVIVGGGMVYGTTPTHAFGLDQKTGEEVWSVKLARTEDEGIDMAPGYHEGRVFVSTVPVTPEGGYSSEVAGTLWALDAKTGKRDWSFRTVAKGSKGGGAAGGGLWYTPAFDGQGGMYFGVGNPSPWPGTEEDPFGADRPGPNLYTNSIVKLDEETGKLDWYHQQTPHDIYDWDLQGPPILVKSKGRDVVMIGGKSGVVIALDRDSGKVLWKRLVGEHNGHDKDSLLAMKKQYDKIETPAEIYPGILGGVIAQMATDGEHVFVPVVNQSAQLQSGAQLGAGGEMAGELVAIDIATGKVSWKKDLESVSFGALTVVNDLVFGTTMDGSVRAYTTRSGSEVWKAPLPAGTNAGVMISGDTVVAPAGMVSGAGQSAQIVAYRLSETR